MVRWRWIVLGLVGLVGLGSLGVVYATDAENRLFALDSRTGRVQWSVGQLRRGHHAPKVMGDRVIVSQSNYESALPFDFGWEPMAPATTGTACPQQGWSLTAYEAKSGRQLWQFCPSAREFPQLDLKLTHGMQLYLTPEQVYVPLVMYGPPGNAVSDRLLTLDMATGTPAWNVPQNFWQSLPFDSTPYLLNGNPQVNKRKISSELFGSSVVGVGDRAIVLTGKLDQPVTLQALAVATGKPVWRRQLAENLLAESIRLGPVVRNYLLANQQQIFQVSPLKGIFAVNGQTGTVQFFVDGIFWGRTLVTDTAFYQFGPTAIAAYDATTGKRQWQHAVTPPQGMNNFFLLGAVDQQTVYARIEQAPKKQPNTTIQVIALNRQDGKPRWQKQLDYPKNLEVAIDPVVSAAGISLVAANSDTLDQSDLQLVTLDAATGTVRWTFPLRIADESQPVIRVYGLLASNPAQIFVKDRAPRWRHWLTHFNIR